MVWGITAGALVYATHQRPLATPGYSGADAFSWCGHFAVIGVLASGVLNALLITGFPHAYDLLGPTLIAQSHPGDDYGGHCAG